MKKIFRYIESKYEDWFDYDSSKISAYINPRYEAYVRFLLVLPVLVLLFLLVTMVGIFVSSPSKFINPIRAHFVKESIQLKTEALIEPQYVNLEWNMVYTNPVMLLKNGKSTGRSFGKQGMNFFRVYYKDQVVACFEHFRGDEISEYDYTLQLGQHGDGKISCRLFVNEGLKEIEKAVCL